MDGWTCAISAEEGAGRKGDVDNGFIGQYGCIENLWLLRQNWSSWNGRVRQGRSRDRLV